MARQPAALENVRARSQAVACPNRPTLCACLEDAADANCIRGRIQNARHRYILAEEFSGLLLIVQVVPGLINVISQDEMFTILREYFSCEYADHNWVLRLGL